MRMMTMRSLMLVFLACGSQATQDSICNPGEDGSCNVEASDDLLFLQAKVSIGEANKLEVSTSTLGQPPYKLTKVGSYCIGAGYLSSLSGQVVDLDDCFSTCDKAPSCAFVSFCDADGPDGATCTGGASNKCSLYTKCSDWGNLDGYNTYMKLVAGQGHSQSPPDVSGLSYQCQGMRDEYDNPETGEVGVCFAAPISGNFAFKCAWSFVGESSGKGCDEVRVGGCEHVTKILAYYNGGPGKEWGPHHTHYAKNCLKHQCLDGPNPGKSPWLSGR